MCLLVAVMLSAPMGVFAQVASEVVEITYARAVQLAMRNLLPLMEIDVQIEEIEERLDELREDIEAMEQGRWRQDLQNELWNNLLILESQIQGLHGTHEALTEASEALWQELLLGLTFIAEDGAADFVAYMLHQTMMNMIFTREVGNAIFSLESQQANLLHHLGRINEDVPELLEDARQAVRILQWHIEILRTHQTQARLEREALLRNTLVALRAMDDAIHLSNMELYLLEETQRRAQVRQAHGAGSVSDVRAAEFDLAQARINLAAQQANRRNVQLGLNHLLGLPLAQNTVVAISIPATTNPTPELTPAQLTQRINATPIVQRLRLELSIARELEEGTALAEARRDHAILAMEVAWHQAQNDARNLRYQRVLWQLELDMANAALDAALTQLELGRITPFDVVVLQYNVALIENQLVAICHQLWRLAFVFSHPSLL